jgi:hypothetical protein
MNSPWAVPMVPTLAKFFSSVRLLTQRMPKVMPWSG